MSNEAYVEIKPKRKPKTVGFKITRNLLILFVFIFLVLICSVILTLGTRALVGRNDFCTTNSKVYEAMLDQANDWLASFPDTYNPGEIKNRSFSIENNTRTFLAQGYWDEAVGKPSLLYVITGSDIDGLNGSEGYIYSPSGIIASKYWLDNYWIKRLDQNIYCYRIQ